MPPVAAAVPPIASVPPVVGLVAAVPPLQAHVPLRPRQMARRRHLHREPSPEAWKEEDVYLLVQLHYAAGKSWDEVASWLGNITQRPRTPEACCAKVEDLELEYAHAVKLKKRKRKLPSIFPFLDSARKIKSRRQKLQLHEAIAADINSPPRANAGMQEN